MILTISRLTTAVCTNIVYQQGYPDTTSIPDCTICKDNVCLICPLIHRLDSCCVFCTISRVSQILDQRLTKLCLISLNPPPVTTQIERGKIPAST